MAAPKTVLQISISQNGEGVYVVRSNGALELGADGTDVVTNNLEAICEHDLWNDRQQQKIGSCGNCLIMASKVESS